MLSRLSPGARATLAALGVVIGVALIFLGLGAFQPEGRQPTGVITPMPETTTPAPTTTQVP